MKNKLAQIAVFEKTSSLKTKIRNHRYFQQQIRIFIALFSVRVRCTEKHVIKSAQIKRKP